MQTTGDIRTEKTLLPDADGEQLPKRKRVTVKALLAAAAGVLLLIFAVLCLNEHFGFSGSIPTWDELYHIFGLRSRAYTGSLDGTVTVHFIDVGQGDCALICADGTNILIDSGEYEQYPVVAQYLRGIGVTRLDTVIMSHPHSDHIGCMYRLVRRYGAEKLIMPDIPEELVPVTSSYSKLMEAVSEQGAEVISARPGDITEVAEGCTLEILAPVGEYEDLNDFSVVCRFTYGKTSFLFCGDIESEAEQDILASGADISADVIKVPHHGSGTSSTRAFVQSVSPACSVFCVGQENDYGHPHHNVVQLYKGIGSRILRTDKDGDIVFLTDGTSISVFTERAMQTSDDAA